ncbi:MAG: NAD-dependent DNA ligase LigA [Firmicutes bacterium]|nr:NAD-dependent DNA ligase LigA [Bacillota bacterium]
MNDKRRIMEEKAAFLNRAAEIYYQGEGELISNQEYDRIYDELETLEKETGIVLSNSPTARVGYEVISGLPKERHPSPMLSLDKTKDVGELRAWLGDKTGLLSWKLDGLTIVLTYRDGRLEKAVTRGDGITGEVITNNAKVFDNIPLVIPEKSEVVVRGEAVISYDDFEEINRTFEDADARYKNPRNLCSGTVRQLNNEITAQRHVKFYAFSLAKGGSADFRNEQFRWLADQGFDTVEYVKVDAENIEEAVRGFEERIVDFPLPSDGLVLIFDDIEYGRGLGTTAKFPRDSIAFKWKDETRETRLSRIIWNVSRTGSINPIAVFDPVDLEGTTVSRASVHNLSIVKELKLGEGDAITVYKANMIIPQIAENLTKSGTAVPPEKCPVCGSSTVIKDDNGVETLHCPNPDCPAKRIKAFTHFVSRNAMNIEGLSEATLEKFVDEGIVREFADLFRLERYRDFIVNMEGFGVKSFDNLVAAAEKASATTPARLLFSLGIPNIGAANAKMIARECRNKWDKIQNITEEELAAIDGIGDIMARGYVGFFKNDVNISIVNSLMEVLTLDESFEDNSEGVLSGLIFVITGKVHHFENRDAVKAAVEAAGGKTASSVSARTDFLINNDINSTSSKNKKAKELDIPIITEEEFLKMLEGGNSNA